MYNDPFTFNILWLKNCWECSCRVNLVLFVSANSANGTRYNKLEKNLMGRFSDYWEDDQQEWIVRTSTKWKRSSYTWMIKVIQAVWKIIWQQWEYRKSILHHEKHPWNQKRILDLNQRIQVRFQLYNKDKYCRHDRQLFTSTVNEVQAFPENLKNQWILSEEHARLRFIA